MSIDTGTLISGTMRPQDLIPALLSIVPHEQKMLDEYQYRPGFGDDHNWWYDPMCSYLLIDLFMMAEDLAPEGYYFGPHEDDGADYGFWQCD